MWKRATAPLPTCRPCASGRTKWFSLIKIVFETIQKNKKVWQRAKANEAGSLVDMSRVRVGLSFPWKQA